MQQSHEQYVNCQYANDYKLLFPIGDGGQANVYLGTKEYKIYALKVYNHGFNKEEGFKREVDFLNNLKFPYLINLVEADPEAEIKLKGQKPQKRLLIVLEFAEAEMFEFIYKEGKFDPQICRTLFRQLIMALKFLNDKGITHRDLKPQNILFDQDFNLKVSDFGMSTFTEGYNKDNKLTSKVGTQGYQCPEIQQSRKYQGLHADFFAAGVILFVMYSGSPPFVSTKPIDKIYKCIKDRQFTKFWGVHEKRKPVGFYPDSFKRLLNQFFSYDPTKRPTFQDLEADEWLNGQIAMGNELKQYMKKRYDKIAETDQIKQKIAQVRKELLEQQLRDSQNSKDQSNRSGQSIIFVDRLREFNNIKLEQLQQTDRRVTYFSKDIGFTLAFLKDFIEECQKNKEIFMSDFIQDIQPTEFKMEVYKDQVQLTFTFEIDQQSEQVLKINGKLYKQDNKLGIQWIKKQGNDFWLSCVIQQLTQRLKVLV